MRWSDEVFGGFSQQGPGYGYRSIYGIVGIIQIMTGSLSLVMGIVAIIESISNPILDYFALFGAGVWSGILVLFAGIFAIITVRKPSFTLILTSMIVTSVSVLVALPMLGIEVAGAIYRDQVYENREESLCKTGDCSQQWIQRVTHSLTAMHSILAFISFIEIAVGVTHIAYCFAAVCCLNSNKSKNKHEKEKSGLTLRRGKKIPELIYHRPLPGYDFSDVSTTGSVRSNSTCMTSSGGSTSSSSDNEFLSTLEKISSVRTM